jgi:hypothetical protein
LNLRRTWAERTRSERCSHSLIARTPPA